MIEVNQPPLRKTPVVGSSFSGSPISEVYLMDCVEGMKHYPDKYFDLACIDPPYGIGHSLLSGEKRGSKFVRTERHVDWDILPTNDFWIELFRVSKNQVVFGANYFFEYLPNTRGFVCWDKNQAMPTLSACELVWTSFDKPAKIMKKSSTDLERFHPTQKPIYVYKYMFEYCRTQEGDKIIDTHLGSGSIAIAAHDYKYELTACELDKEYYDKAIQRITNHTNQQKLF
jgi:site-specific DNA-methyltransferase (adenine-specific)